jgi:hypothetical protein
MFVGDPVQFQGYIFRIDGFGRAHVIPDPLPDHFDWLVFHNVDAAKAFLRKKGASR